MNLLTLLAELRNQQVHIWLEDGKLRYKAPRTPGNNLLQTIKAHRQELIDFLADAQQGQAELIALPAERPAKIPLAPGQERLWFVQQLMPDSPLYHNPVILRLSGDLHTNRLENALIRLQTRHEILRTVYHQNHDERWQVVLPPENFMLLYQTMDGQPAQTIKAAINACIMQPFQLGQDVPWRALLIREAPGSHILVLVIHHIAIDAWSSEILRHELFALYADDDPDLPDLSCQYADFALWHQALRTTSRYEAQTTFWQHLLSGVPHVIELPDDHARPPQQRFEGAVFRTTCSDTLLKQIQAFSRQTGSTLFVVCFAAFATLLYRYTRQERFLIGVPTANRPRPEFANLIGFFANLVPVPFDFTRASTFHQLIEILRDQMPLVLENQSVSFEQIVELVRPQRSPRYHQLIQVTCQVLESSAVDVRSQGDIRVEAIRPSQHTSRFDLMFDVYVEQDALHLVITYATGLFESRTIQQLADHYQVLLASLLAEPRSLLTKIPLLTSETRTDLINRMAARRVPAEERHLSSWFEARVQQNPHLTAVTFADQSLTYAQLNQAANRLAHYLLARGVQAEDTVALCVAPGMQMIIAIMAILKAGACYVPLDTQAPPERLTYIMQDCNAHLLLSEQKYLSQIPVPNRFDLDVIHDELRQQPVTNPVVRRLAAHLAYLIYTSGSTGHPKGVAVEHRAVTNLFRACEDWSQFDEADVWTLFHSFAFDFSVWEIWGALLYGGRLVVVPPHIRHDLAAFWQLLIDEQVTVLNQTPSAFKALLQLPGFQATSADALALRFIIFGGEALKPLDLQSFYAKFGAQSTQLINMYGITETTVHVTYRPLITRDMHQTKSLIGRPVDNTGMYILDEWMQVVPVNAIGELYISGDRLARGYHKQAALTARRFVPNPFSEEPGARLYKSGDLAQLRHDGDVEFIGRNDFQVKIRGFRIEPGEIEVTLGQHPAVQQVVVLARTDMGDEPILVAYVRCQHNDLSDRALRDFLQPRLPHYMQPGFIVFTDEFPLTINGKLDRAALPVPAELAGTDDDAVLPRSELEQHLSRIFNRLLPAQTIGIHDDFFLRGGHSLLAVRLVAHIQDELDGIISLQDIFTFPTIAGLAAHLEVTSRPAAAKRRQPLQHWADGHAQNRTIAPASFAQERIWLLEQIEQPGNTYHVPLLYQIDGVLQPDTVRRTCRIIINRHTPLQSAFVHQDGTLQQIIDTNLSVQLMQYDVSQFAPQQREIRAYEYAEQLINTPFDLSRAPLWHLALITLSDTHHLLVWVFHHSIIDDWSINLLRQEFIQTYQALQQDKRPDLPQLPLSYMDYAVWQRETLQGACLEQLLAYWTHQLEDTRPLQLITDKPRTARLTYRGAMLREALSLSVLQQLEHLGHTQNVSLFQVSLAAFALMLYRYSQQTHFNVGVPVANRHHGDSLNHLIGFFTNTLAIPCRVDSTLSFDAFLQTIRQTVLEAFAYQDLPFERLVSLLHTKTDRQIQPVIQTLFVWQDRLQQSAAVHSLDRFQLTESSQHTGSAKFDVTVFAIRTKHGMHLELEYRTDLFLARTARAMLDFLAHSLVTIADDPAITIRELMRITPAEKQRFIALSNIKRHDTSSGCVHHLFEAQVKKTPHHIALIEQEQSWTYARLNEMANRLARRLLDRGLQPETPIAIYAERTHQTIVAILAVLKAGAYYLPLDYHYPQARLRFMLQHSGAQLLLSTQPAPGDLLLHLNGHGIQQISLTNLDDDTHACNNLNNDAILPHHGAYLIYTSGSTGQPRGVVMPHRALWNLMQWQKQRSVLADFSESRTVQFAPLSFDVSFQEMFATWHRGDTLVLMPDEVRQQPDKWLAFLRDARIERLFLPFIALHHLATLAENSPADLHLREVITAGEQLQITPAIATFFSHHLTSAVLDNQYGPTEAHVVSACLLIGNPANWPARPAIGRAIPNTHLYVLDDDLKPCPPGMPGELYIGGVAVARHYINAPRQTAERFLPDCFTPELGSRMYRTGDRVRWTGADELEFLGRVDRQVKIRGYRVEPDEISQHLSQHPLIAEAAAVVIDRDNASRLAAYICFTQPDPAISATELRRFLKHRLPAYMIPDFYYILDALPLTPSGKVDYRTMSQMRYPQLTTRHSEELDEPQSDLQIVLLDIFKDVLENPHISIDDDFFEAGGHSLLLLSLTRRITSTFNLSLSMRQLMTYRTVVAIAQHIEHTRFDVARKMLAVTGNPEGETLVTLREDGNRPPIFCFHTAIGNTFGYLSFADLLPEGPVYGLHQIPAADYRLRSASIDKMAADYIKLIQQVQPVAPYHLCGWSMGGLLAFEVARLLASKGAGEIKLLLLDSPSPALPDSDPPDSRVEYAGHEQSIAAASEPILNMETLIVFGRTIGLTEEDFAESQVDIAGLDVAEGLVRLREVALAKERLPRQMTLQMFEQMLYRYQSNMRAMNVYHGGSYEGETMLVLAADEPSSRTAPHSSDQWELFISPEKITRHEVTGHHDSMIYPPHVQKIVTLAGAFFSQDAD